MPPRKHSDETIDAARRLLAEGMTQTAIARTLGVPASTLRHHLMQPRADIALPAAGTIRRRVTRKSFRPHLVARLWATAERQVNDIDTRLAEAGGDPASLERDAKTLAILARTVRDLVALDETMSAKSKDADAAEPFPRDIEAFRRDLAEKLERIGALEAHE